VIVLLDNDGGGIFHFLAVRKAGAAFEQHVATPHGVPFADAASLFGCAYERVASPAAFRDALERALRAETTTIISVRTDRDANVALHRRVWEAVAEAVSPTAPEAAPRA
jgi:2-succinyl-5-enolpyruvyl-6-hydroxy-3-cyclohexene-1-carboxylate synthase